MIERRKFHRYNTALEVEYDVVNDVKLQSKTYTLNVSEGGVSIPLNKAIRPGKKIRLKFRLPHNDKEIDAVGKVMWRKAFDKSLAPEENAGIEFLDMCADDKVALIGYLSEYAA